MIHRSRNLPARLAVVAVLGCSLACGQGGDAAPRLPAGGTVLLPPGSSLAMESLRVVGAQGPARITSGGKFTATVPDEGPALVGLFDASDRLVLLGHVDAADPAGGEVSARRTGVGLLFQALGAPLLPPGMWKQALALIAASPQADALAAVIGARVAANPTALIDGDSAIADALQAAAAELVPLAKAPAPAPSPAPAARRQATLAAVGLPEAFSKVTVDTPGTQSGITIRVNPTATASSSTTITGATSCTSSTGSATCPTPTVPRRSWSPGES
jgi:hypothetical protein